MSLSNNILKSLSPTNSLVEVKLQIVSVTESESTSLIVLSDGNNSLVAHDNRQQQSPLNAGDIILASLQYNSSVPTLSSSKTLLNHPKIGSPVPLSDTNSTPISLPINPPLCSTPTTPRSSNWSREGIFSPISIHGDADVPTARSSLAVTPSDSSTSALLNSFLDPLHSPRKPRLPVEEKIPSRFSSLSSSISTESNVRMEKRSRASPIKRISNQPPSLSRVSMIKNIGSKTVGQNTDSIFVNPIISDLISPQVIPPSSIHKFDIKNSITPKISTCLSDLNNHCEGAFYQVVQSTKLLDEIQLIGRILYKFVALKQTADSSEPSDLGFAFFVQEYLILFKQYKELIPKSVVEGCQNQVVVPIITSGHGVVSQSESRPITTPIMNLSPVKSTVVSIVTEMQDWFILYLQFVLRSQDLYVRSFFHVKI
ncbi:hypothetical protein RCL1_000478 [Eukaryota sp. TZLM3-RCL]